MTSFATASADAFPLFAQTAGAGQAGGIFGNQFMMIPLMFVMMYFILIRPQRQKQKQHEALLKSIKAGDHVITAGGVHGIISSVKDTTVMLKVADNVKVEYDRTAIATVKKSAGEPDDSVAK